MKTPKKKPKAASWALKAGGLYFREMTQLGARFTADPDVAHKFDSREEAMRHPAYSFPMATWKPFQLRTRKGERSR